MSISRICASASLRIPRIRRRVVCGRGVTIATLCPTSRFTSVDLPTLVRPATATKPARCSPIALTALLFNSIEREARRRLLALFLAAAFGHAEVAPRDSDSSREALGVIGPVGRDQLVHRLRAKMAIRDFLQFGFVVALGGRSADIVCRTGARPLAARARVRRRCKSRRSPPRTRPQESRSSRARRFFLRLCPAASSRSIQLPVP